MMLVGSNVRPAACRQRNMIWLFVARSLFGLSSCMLSMAFKPKGVAALSRPRKFAAKLSVMNP
jgi:hypothetical protein